MREVGLGKKEIAERAKKNAAKLDGRLTEPNGESGGGKSGKDDEPNGGEK